MLATAPSSTKNDVPSLLMASHSRGAGDPLLEELARLFKFQQQQQHQHNKSTATMHPLLMPQDAAVSSLQHSRLASGHSIACFVIGGESRLCFPQIITQVLSDVRLADVNSVFTELKIHCSIASREQLDVLKMNGVMPITADSCGLITKTDAERLTAVLRSNASGLRLPSVGVQHANAIAVRHDCFGGCDGQLFTELYPSPCVECRQCQQLYDVEQFTLHSHSLGERIAVCHWGFDATNWRYYLRLADAVFGDVKLQHRLDQFKFPISPSMSTTPVRTPLKRSAAVDVELDMLQQLAAKRQQLMLDQAVQQLLLTASPTLHGDLQKLASAQALLTLSGLNTANTGYPTTPTKLAMLDQHPLKPVPVVAAAAVEPNRPARSDSTQTTSASESGEDDNILDTLLSRHVSGSVLQTIREKIADSQRVLELKVDALSSEVSTLRAENASLRRQLQTSRLSSSSSSLHSTTAAITELALKQLVC